MYASTDELTNCLGAPYGDDDPFGEPMDVTDLGSAMHAVERLRELRADLKARETAAQERTQRITDWLDDERARIGGEVDRYSTALENWAREQIPAGAKRKSIDLPGARVSLRAQPPQWKWPEAGMDADVLLTWAADNSLTRVTVTAAGETGSKLADQANRLEVPFKEELDKAGIKKSCAVRDGLAVDKATGETVPGVAIEDHLPDKVTIDLLD